MLYMHSMPNVTVNDTTCGKPRDDAFHIFRDAITADQPWPGLLVQCSIGCLWYWCCDQVSMFVLGVGECVCVYGGGGGGVHPRLSAHLKSTHLIFVLYIMLLLLLLVVVVFCCCCLFY